MRIKTKYLTIISLLAGAILIGIGVFAGQNADVLHKAVLICLECVGIG